MPWSDGWTDPDPTPARRWRDKALELIGRLQAEILGDDVALHFFFDAFDHEHGIGVSWSATNHGRRR